MESQKACRSKQKLNVHLEEYIECFHYYITYYNIPEGQQLWIIGCMESICMAGNCGWMGRKMKTHLVHSPKCLDYHKMITCTDTVDMVMKAISKAKCYK